MLILTDILFIIHCLCKIITYLCYYIYIYVRNNKDIKYNYEMRKNMEKLQKIDVYNILYIMQQRVKKRKFIKIIINSMCNTK